MNGGRPNFATGSGMNNRAVPPRAAEASTVQVILDPQSQQKVNKTHSHGMGIDTVKRHNKNIVKLMNFIRTLVTKPEFNIVGGTIDDIIKPLVEEEYENKEKIIVKTLNNGNVP